MRRKLSTLINLALVAALILPGILRRAPASIQAFVDPLLTSAGDVSVIVTASSADEAAAAVVRAGGAVTSRLWLVDAVGATLPASRLGLLSGQPGVVSITRNAPVSASGLRPGWVTERKEKKSIYSLAGSGDLAGVMLGDGSVVAIGQASVAARIDSTGHAFWSREDLPFEGLISSPVFDGVSTVYFVGQKSPSSDRFNIIALDVEDGSILWREQERSVVTSLAIGPTGDRLYAMANADNAVLKIVDPLTGAELQRFRPDGDRSGPYARPVVAADGAVYLQSSGILPNGDAGSSHIYAIHLAEPDSGIDLLWHLSLPMKVGEGLDFAPTTTENRLFLVSIGGSRIYGLDRVSGELLFSTPLPDKPIATPVVGPDGTLLVTTQKSLFAIEPDGALRFVMPANKLLSAPAVSDDGVAYVADRERLIALNARNGEALWTLSARNDIIGSPVILADGSVILGDAGDRLYVVTPAGQITTGLVLDATLVAYLTSPEVPGAFAVLYDKEQLGFVGDLSSTWDPARKDVQPTDSQARWELANPIGIDVGADVLHGHFREEVGGNSSLSSRALDGSGVGIAVVDSGVYMDSAVKTLLSQGKGTSVRKQYSGQFDFTGDALGTIQCPHYTDPDYNATYGYCYYPADLSRDNYGHGSHVAGIIWSQITDDSTGTAMGVAPGASVISVRVLDDYGNGTYEDVIQGIQWVVDNRNNPELPAPIRILNMSLSGEASAPYFVDPLNRAVEKAWAVGIVVLAAAGNTGPRAESITVPGNDPYVITVGALDNGRTPGYWGDDRVAPWSASGPTRDGFVKPDVLAPGANIVSFMHNEQATASVAHLVEEHPDYQETQSLFRMHGTSMATAAASGVVALMLQANPALTPDQVKFRLMVSARPTVDDSGRPTETIFRQGAGRIWAPDAIQDASFPPDGVANVGMDIQQDLAHGWALLDEGGHPVLDDAGSPMVDEAELAFHYQGPVQRMASEDGQIYLYFLDGQDELGENVRAGLGMARTEDLSWLNPDDVGEQSRQWVSEEGTLTLDSGAFIWSGAFAWAGAFIWAGAFAWAGAFIWSGAFAWAGAFIWSGAFAWAGAFIWSGAFAWAGAFIWSGAFAWAGAFIWSGAFAWAGGHVNLAQTEISANDWVEDERPPGTWIYVADIDGTTAWTSRSSWSYTTTVTIRDEFRTRVPGATVTVTFDDIPGEQSCETDGRGVCLFATAVPEGAELMVMRVAAVSHPSLPYVAAGNEDRDGDSNGTVRVGSRPLVRPTLSLTDMDATSSWSSSSTWSLSLTISSRDYRDLPRAGSVIEGDWTRGLSGPDSCVVNADGLCGFTRAVPESISEVKFQVRNIADPLFVYSQELDSDPDGDSTDGEIVIKPPALRPSLHVSDLDRTSRWISRNAWFMTVTISTVDHAGRAVSGAVVGAEWTRGLHGAVSCTTDASGQCTIAADVPDSMGEVKLKVLNLSHGLLYYKDGDNWDPDGESNGTEIAVKPPTNRPYTSVADLDGVSSWSSSTGWDLSVTITMHTDAGQPLANMPVSAEWTGGLSGAVACTTDSLGQCVVAATAVPPNVTEVKLKVMGADHWYHVYRADRNADPDGDSNGTEIRVKPPAYRPGMHVATFVGTAAWVDAAQWEVTYVVTVVDDAGMPVQNVLVDAQWTSNLTGYVSCVTDAAGQCAITARVPASKGDVKLKVIRLTDPMLYYKSGDNQATEVKIVRPAS